MTTVNMLDAKTNLSKLVEAVESGAEEEIIIARNGKPAARIVALRQKDASRRLGAARGQFLDFTLEEFNSTDEEIARNFYGEPTEQPELVSDKTSPLPGAKKR